MGHTWGKLSSLPTKKPPKMHPIEAVLITITVMLQPIFIQLIQQQFVI